MKRHLGNVVHTAAIVGLIALASTAAASLIGSAQGARLPVSTLTIKVQSVDQQSSSRETYANGRSLETTKYVARAHIQKIVKTDHGLSAGAVIDVLYERRQPTLPGIPDRFLQAGETVTITVFGSGRTFTWR